MRHLKRFIKVRNNEDMLNRIEITGLYGHYTYDLPLSSGQRKDICFLTGPNGYGCRIRGRIRGTGTFIHNIFPHICSNKSHKWAA